MKRSLFILGALVSLNPLSAQETADRVAPKVENKIAPLVQPAVPVEQQKGDIQEIFITQKDDLKKHLAKGKITVFDFGSES